MKITILALTLLSSALTLAQPLELIQAQTPNVAELEPRWEHTGVCRAVLRKPLGKDCNVHGTINHRYAGLVNLDWTLDHCQNACVCAQENCKSMSWRPQKKDATRGECIRHYVHLREMGFEKTTFEQHFIVDNPARDYYDRTCFHKGKPIPLNIMTSTTSAAKPTATAEVVKRDIPLEDHLVMALAGGI